MNVKYNASVTLNCISLFAKAKQSEHTTCTLIARTLLEISISIIYACGHNHIQFSHSHYNYYEENTLFH